MNGPLFLPLAGVEQWLRGTFDHVGGAGSVAAGLTEVEYQVTHSALDVRELTSPFPFVAGHSRERTAGVLQVGRSGEGGRHARLGAGATRWSMDRGGAAATRIDATVFTSLGASIGRSTTEISGALARSSGGPVVGQGVLPTRMLADSLTGISAALSYVQHTTGDDGTWIDRALLGLDTLRRERDARAWADLGAGRRLANGLIADAGARVGVLEDVRLLATDGVPVSGAASGGIAELRLGLSRPPSTRVAVARLAYRYVTPLGGDATLRGALRATPAHTLDGQLVAAPAPDLRFGAFVQVASRAEWAALRGAAAAPTTLPAISRLDVSAEKWFWRHRLRTQLLLRNLLNSPERSHPLGADLPLRVHLTFALALPAGAGSG